MVVQSKIQRALQSRGQAGLVIEILCSAAGHPLATDLNRAFCYLGGEVAHAVLRLLLAEGRLLASHALNFERLLDCYCLLASVVPLVECIFGLR